MKTKINIFIVFLILCFVLFSCQKEFSSLIAVPKQENELSLESYSDEQIYLKIVEQLAKSKCYFVEMNGTTTAKKGIITYKQLTNTKLYANDTIFFNEVVSNSSLVNHKHQVYVNHDNVSYFDSSNDGIIKTTKRRYIDKYGKVPSHQQVLNYVVNQNTIVKLYREYLENGYALTFQLDPSLSTIDLKKQMIEFGGLNKEPVFEEVYLIVNIDKHFELLSFSCKEKYQISKSLIGTMNCVQELHSTVYYDGYSEPNLNDFK